MVSIRAEFAEAIREALPDDLDVIDHAKSLDAIAAPVLMLERTVVAKPANAMGGYLTTFVVHVISPVIGRDTADDALDDALDVALVALDRITFCNWTTATRSVFLESYPSYQIQVQTVTEKTKGI